MATDFLLPELGEQVAGGDVLRILVNAGDTIAKDQPVVELETDKATIEVPSSVAGTITSVNVKLGQKVKVGQSILTVEAGAPAAPAAASAPAPAAPAPSANAAAGANTSQKVAGDEPGFEQHVEGQRRADQAADKSGSIETGQAAPGTARRRAGGGHQSWRRSARRRTATRRSARRTGVAVRAAPRT